MPLLTFVSLGSSRCIQGTRTRFDWPPACATTHRRLGTQDWPTTETEQYRIAVNQETSSRRRNLNKLKDQIFPTSANQETPTKKT